MGSTGKAFRVAVFHLALQFGAAEAQTVCRAADVMAREGAGCPASGACNITKTLTLGADCTLDFSGRAVTMAAAGRLNLGSGTVTILAASFTMQPGAYIDGRGSGTTLPASLGGDLTLLVDGDVTLQKSGSTRARIDVSGASSSGDVHIEATGSVSMFGLISASNLTSSADGGTVEVKAAGDIATRAGSEILATGGINGSSGSVRLEAGGKIDLGDLVDVGGRGNGDIDLTAGGTVTTRDLKGNSTNNHGGYVFIVAGGDVQLLGPISMQNNNGIDGEGGLLDVESSAGSILIAANVSLDGSGPDGDGGNLDLRALGDITVASNASVIVSQSLEPTGDVDLRAGHQIVIDGNVTANGREFGGSVNVTAGTDISIAGNLAGRGIGSSSTGGELSLVAGRAFTVGGTVNFGGGPVGQGYYGYPSVGGMISIEACSLDVPRGGEIFARASGEGGAIAIQLRHRATIHGTISALGRGSESLDGTVELSVPRLPGPVIRTGAIEPEPFIELTDGCPDCLDPCSGCGDGVKQVDEECDDSNKANCDGCSEFCQVEQCSASTPCAVCNPLLGCPEDPPACTPSPNPPATRTSTSTVTPTSTATARPSASPTPTQSASRTPTLGAPATATETIGQTPTVAAPLTTTSTPSHSLTATPVVSVATPTATEAEPTLTSTPGPRPTESPTVTVPACAGDCGVDREVTVDEILMLVNIALGTASFEQCTPGDANGDGEVTIEEILAAVRNALSGCG